jgi:competence protein ComEC
LKSWNPYPLVRAFFPFAAGIVTAILLDREFHIPLWIFILLIAFSGFYVFYFSKKISYKTRWIFGVFMYLLMFACGFELCILRTAKFNSDHYCKIETPGNYTYVRITAPPQVREKSVRVEAEILATGDSSISIACSGNVMLYFAVDSSSTTLEYGDILALNVRPEEVKAPANPGEFDYQNYLAMRGVYHQAYVPERAFIKTGVGYQNPLFQWAFDARDKILKIFIDNGLAGREYAVTSALLIGYTEKLDADLLHNYSGTGAMHILSVSGLHVGIIFIVLNALLFFLDKFKHGKVPKTVILIMAIWAYALLTGLSPSVLRASLMFSLIVLSGAFNRDSDIYNNLAASAIALLIINPFFITDIGFQLSYLAVLGIVSIQHPVSSLWTPRWWLLKQIWGIVSVSIAAQLLTLPVCLYYFHQFPNYFLITNLIAIPLSSLVMYVAMIVLALSFAPLISGFMAKFLVWLVYTLNSTIGFIEKMPGSLSDGLYINVPEMLLLYALIILLLLFFIRKQKRMLIPAAFVTILLLFSFLFRNIDSIKQNEWAVYNIKKTTAIDLISGRHRTLLADSSLLSDPNKLDFHTGNFMDKLGINSEIRLWRKTLQFNDPVRGVFSEKGYIQFLDKRIAVIDGPEAAMRKLKVDYLIISGNPQLKIAEILECYNTGIIIIDASNSKYKAEKWLKECRKLKMPCWSVQHNGAFVAEY